MSQSLSHYLLLYISQFIVPLSNHLLYKLLRFFMRSLLLLQHYWIELVVRLYLLQSYELELLALTLWLNL